MKKLLVSTSCLLALTTGAVHAADVQQAPYVVLTSQFATLALPFEKLEGRAVATDESGYVLLVLSPYEHAVFSQGKLVRYMCLDGGEARVCRATTTPRATRQYSFGIADDEKAQSMNLRILDTDYFNAHSNSSNPQEPYAITHVDGKDCEFSYDKTNHLFVINQKN